MKNPAIRNQFPKIILLPLIIGLAATGWAIWLASDRLALLAAMTVLFIAVSAFVVALGQWCTRRLTETAAAEINLERRQAELDRLERLLERTVGLLAVCNPPRRRERFSLSASASRRSRWGEGRGEVCIPPL
jgi:hypothetical protein